jgi:hypothetical protein
LISAKEKQSRTALSIQVLPDGFCVFKPSLDDRLDRVFLGQQEDLLLWLSQQTLTDVAIKLIYSGPATAVPKELFSAADASDYLKFHIEDWAHTAFTELKNFGLFVIFAHNQKLEAALKQAHNSIMVTHSAHELLKRALVSPNKEIPRLVSIFHPKHIELVYHKGPNLLVYNQFAIEGDLDASYYLQLALRTSKQPESAADVICYENGSKWGAESFKYVNEWASGAQYITEVYPFH